MRATPFPSNVFDFPQWVDERAARTVASGVVVLTVAYLVTGSGWILAAIAAGFVARVLSGPTLSPLARLATQVLVPRYPGSPRLVPGSPKRFAQGIGAVLSVSALLAHATGAGNLAFTLVAMITAAALLEAAAGFCLGCVIFARLMAIGIIPESACAACNDLSGRRALTPDMVMNKG